MQNAVGGKMEGAKKNNPSQSNNQWQNVVMAAKGSSAKDLKRLMAFRFKLVK